jgi:hypothetical protein
LLIHLSGSPSPSPIVAGRLGDPSFRLHTRRLRISAATPLDSRYEGQESPQLPPGCANPRHPELEPAPRFGLTIPKPTADAIQLFSRQLGSLISGCCLPRPPPAELGETIPTNFAMNRRQTRFERSQQGSFPYWILPHRREVHRGELPEGS